MNIIRKYFPSIHRNIDRHIASDVIWSEKKQNQIVTQMRDTSKMQKQLCGRHVLTHFVCFGKYAQLLVATCFRKLKRKEKTAVCRVEIFGQTSHDRYKYLRFKFFNKNSWKTDCKHNGSCRRQIEFPFGPWSGSNNVRWLEYAFWNFCKNSNPVNLVKLKSSQRVQVIVRAVVSFLSPLVSTEPFFEISQLFEILEISQNWPVTFETFENNQIWIYEQK